MTFLYEMEESIIAAREKTAKRRGGRERTDDRREKMAKRRARRKRADDRRGKSAKRRGGRERAADWHEKTARRNEKSRGGRIHSGSFL